VYDAALSGTERSTVIRRIIKKTEKQGGGIILLHDGHDSHLRMEKKLAKNPQGVFDRSWIPELVDELIYVLLEKGFSLNSCGVF